MTALTTCPFLTVPSGVASLTEAVMTSPRRPYWPAEPPRRWMQAIFLAPELSATSKTVPIWIMSNPLLGPLQDLADPPTLRSGQRAGRDDLDLVADLALVLLVVGGELRRPLQVAVVEPVGGGVLDRHHDRLVHLAAHHPADLDLPPAARRGLRLLRALRLLLHRRLLRPLTRPASRAAPSAPGRDPCARRALGRASPAAPSPSGGAGRRAARRDRAPCPCSPRS